ncbi:MAG: PLP-dependent aminotransferase family protein [Lachnospiraceae bacterium]|nr:PLP-dependent aminotransferase family protein [Lachnospiraceae bacterium]
MLELLIPLDSDSGKPLYEQIYDYIRIHIADGKISCGEKLPSTRFLASHLQVSRSTVELAYEQLLSEGYIESEPCRGYYASDISELYLSGTKFPSGRPFLPQKQKTPYRIVFSPDENEFAYFPFGAWRKISKDLLAADDTTLFTAGEAAGEWELREAVCRYLYHARGVNCLPEQIVIGAGNEYLLILLSQILGSPKKVAIENPTYLKAYQTLLHMNDTMLLLSRDKSGIRMEDVRRLKPDIVYVMPSHQFPMGTVMPMKRRLELLRWAAEKPGRYLIEDDHDSEFRYRGKPIPSLQGNDANETVIYMGTFSKSISPAVRVSYMVLPEPLLFAYQANCGFYASTVPKEQQRLLASFLTQGYFERYLNKMRRVYKGKHDLFLSLLRQEPWVHMVYGDYAGMHLLAELNTQMRAEWIVKEAGKRGVRVYALEEYMVPGARDFLEGKPTLLLGYGALCEKDMKEGIAVLREILMSH